MNISTLSLAITLSLAASAAFGQDNRTAEDYERDTELLRARQAYYEQVLATARSEETAANAPSAFELARLTEANQIRTAELSADLAVANALKSSGLSAATGKEGSITMTSADKTPLAFRNSSLVLVDGLTNGLCERLKALQLTSKTFIAPANYELLVQKSSGDVAQVKALHDTAVDGLSRFSGIQTQSVAAVAGALVTAQYLAGGVQALSKLFRTDHSLTYAATDRRALFEQQLVVRCADRIEGNVEGRLRLQAARTLHNWIVNMASFVERYDAINAVTTTEKTRIVARIAEIRADKEMPAARKAAELDGLNAGLDALKDQEKLLETYKAPVASMKTFLASDKTNVFDSFVWGHEYLQVAAPVVQLNTLHRLTYTLAVEDSMLKSSAAFRADRIRPFSTAELTYALHDPTGVPLSSGYFSETSAQSAVKLKSLPFGNVGGSVAKPSSLPPPTSLPTSPPLPSPKSP